MEKPVIPVMPRSTKMIMRPPVHFVTTVPRCRPCGTCRRLTLTGLSEGCPYRVDPVPLTMHAELRAMLHGRATWKLVAGKPVVRTGLTIGARKPWQPWPLVLADHVCHQAPEPSDVDTTFLPVITRLIAVTRAKTPESGDGIDYESESVALVCAALGGRVIATENPPF